MRDIEKEVKESFEKFEKDFERQVRLQRIAVIILITICIVLTLYSILKKPVKKDDTQKDCSFCIIVQK